MAGGLKGHPSGSGHSNQTASKFSSRGHVASSSAPGMENKEAGTQSQPKLLLLDPSWARSL